jgi:hypothetical protein
VLILGRCFRSVDPSSEESSELIAIDEETDHQIVHRRRFGKTNGVAHKPLDPRPQVDMFALNSLRVFLADDVLLGGDMPLVRAPSVRVK